MTTFHVLTLFPEMVENGLNTSILGRAREKGVLRFHTVNIRDYTADKHRKVDDYPYGGGAGMLMQAQPVFDAHRAVLEEIRGRRGGEAFPQGPVRTVYLTPQGRPFTQAMARELAGEEELIFLCGHYEGIDERVLEEVVTDRVSIGDYVLTGGELAAMVMIDAVSRLVPGVLGNDESAQTESFHRDLLEYPQYSRPEVWHGKGVPQVLLTGDHRKIRAWRLAESEKLTGQLRPDLYDRYLQKRQVVERLSRRKRRNIHMMELLERGLGEVLYAEGENVLLAGPGKLYMADAGSLEEAERMLESGFGASGPARGWELCSLSPFVKEVLVQRWGGQVLMECVQACYTRREPLPVRHRDIRVLGEEWLGELQKRYSLAGERYLRERLAKGEVFGAFLEGRLAGFIGLHEEGSMGMLWVDEDCRRQGIGASLEAWLINRLLERGETPYGQIEAGNLGSIRLQERLGLYLAEGSVWWVEDGRGLDG